MPVQAAPLVNIALRVELVGYVRKKPNLLKEPRLRNPLLQPNVRPLPRRGQGAVGLPGLMVIVGNIRKYLKLQPMDTEMYVILILAILVWLALAIIVIRLAIRHKRTMWNQQQIINLLVLIAEKSHTDVNSEKLTMLKQMNNNVSDEFLMNPFK